MIPIHGNLKIVQQENLMREIKKQINDNIKNVPIPRDRASGKTFRKLLTAILNASEGKSVTYTSTNEYTVDFYMSWAQDISAYIQGLGITRRSLEKAHDYRI